MSNQTIEDTEDTVSSSGANTIAAERAPTSEPAMPAATRRSRLRAPLMLAALAAALLTLGIVPRLRASTALTAQTAAQQLLDVAIVKPTVAPSQQELLLPGSVTPFAEASVYARTSGYIAHWNTDIGAHVKAGQLLATIEAPELDAQLRQARADEATAQANYMYAKTTAARWQQMLSTQSVSQQDTDTRVADMQAKQAGLDAARANVAHLAELVGYEQVQAPFNGVITARNIDIGSLVTAGGTPGTAGVSGELFHIQQTDTLRVFVDVPQDDAPYVTSSTGVYLTTQQYPGHEITAHVARNAGAIDPASRTLRVEVDVDNRDGALMPGSYVRVHLTLATTKPALDLPVSALLFRSNGVTVAIVGSDGRTALKTVHVGRDFGTRIEITSGLLPTDRVIDNPGDAITAGEAVRIEHTAAASAGAAPNSATPAAPAPANAQPSQGHA